MKDFSYLILLDNYYYILNLLFKLEHEQGNINVQRTNI